MATSETWLELLFRIAAAILACPAFISLPLSLFLRRPNPDPSRVSRTSAGIALQGGSVIVALLGGLIVHTMIESCASCFMLWLPVGLMALAAVWGVCILGLSLVLSERFP